MYNSVLPWRSFFSKPKSPVCKGLSPRARENIDWLTFTEIIIRKIEHQGWRLIVFKIKNIPTKFFCPYASMENSKKKKSSKYQWNFYLKKNIFLGLVCLMRYTTVNLLPPQDVFMFLFSVLMVCVSVCGVFFFFNELFGTSSTRSVDKMSEYQIIK